MTTKWPVPLQSALLAGGMNTGTMIRLSRRSLTIPMVPCDKQTYASHCKLLQSAMAGIPVTNHVLHNCNIQPTSILDKVMCTIPGRFVCQFHEARSIYLQSMRAILYRFCTQLNCVQCKNEPIEANSTGHECARWKT
jgi:hypothetical protein